MKIVLDKLGRDCYRCANKPSACPKCERNVNLKKLQDHYLKKDFDPKIPVEDDTSPTKVSNANKKVLGEWGMRGPGKRHPAPPSEQKRESQAQREGSLGEDEDILESD